MNQIPLGKTLPYKEVADRLGMRASFDLFQYVSVEYSSAFKNFAKNYYIVIIANDSTESPLIKDALANAKKSGLKDAYIKNDDVYLGSIH